MKQTTTDTDSILEAPAPWELRGQGYICLLQCPQELLNAGSFITESLRSKLQKNSYSFMIFIDYRYSPVGPYYELLFIPGRFTFEDKLQHLSISRIFVSSKDSVINGRRNWGIPKEIAQFNVHSDKDGIEHITVSSEGKVFAELAFSSWPIPIPISTALLPKSWVTLGQHQENMAFIYQPKASGYLRPAKLTQVKIDATQFPAIQLDQVKMTVKITHLKMHFPEAKTIAF